MVSNRAILAVVIAAIAVLGAAVAVGLTGPSGPASAGSAGDIGADGNASSSELGTNSGNAVTVAGANQVQWVREDRRLRVSVALEANESVTRTVSLRVDEDGDGELDRTVAEKRQQLPTSGTAQVTFRVPAGELPMGDHQYGVVAGEVTRMLGTTTVVRTPAFEISGAPDSVSTVAGTSTNVSLTVENVGDYGATRTVMLHLGTDGSGSVASGDPARERSVTLGSGQTQQLSVPVPSSSLDPGNYTYRLAVATDIEDDRVTDNVTTTGTLTVMEPARFSISTAPVSNVTRGTPATVAATVTNTGDVGGTTAVALRGPDGTMIQRTVTLPGGAATNVSFEVATADRSRGDYGYTVATDDDETRTSVQVREGVLAVSELRGNETLIVGDPMVFTANVTNVGDAPTTGAVQLRIDLDDDDRPEYDGIFRNVTLAPGNETTVRFDVPYMEDPDPLNQVEDLPTGTYIYGIYTEDDNETSVFDARSKPTSFDPFTGGSSGSSDGEGDGRRLERASRDEISQAKYGLAYEELSGETRSQIDEIYVRQPFAGDLGITDIRTREEIARQEYGLDVRRGDRFQFQSIETDLQQRIESDFDAQFTTQQGDRIESWDELARQQHGTTYGNLSPSQQESVRAAYQNQFE